MELTVHLDDALMSKRTYVNHSPTDVLSIKRLLSEIYELVDEEYDINTDTLTLRFK